MAKSSSSTAGDAVAAVGEAELATERILRVAVPSPLRRLFDYLPPVGVAPGHLVPGLRVRVPFGRGQRVGVVVGVGGSPGVDAARLKRALELLDPKPLLPPSLLALAAWAAAYYHHPPGEAVLATLPAALRQGRPAHRREPRRWVLTAAGRAATPASLRRAPRQLELLRSLQAAPEGVSAASLRAGPGGRGSLAALAAKGWITAVPDPPAERAAAVAVEPAPALNAAQQAAAAAVLEAAGGFQVLLLDGVTGSGKTEVYMQAIAGMLARGRQALVLVPEIALTPQTVDRFRRRLGVALAVVHSGLSDGERLQSWLTARSGAAAVVIGTRSAVFTPLARPGVIIVDEEHDPSFKQQEGLRHSARDVAIMRARMEGIPVLLGSATPSLESLRNALEGRYRRLELPERAGVAAPPSYQLVDIRAAALEQGLSGPLLAAMGRHLEQGAQVLLFLNRRGYAPTLICHECGWIAECRRCDARLTLHRGEGLLRCHHCAAEAPLPVQCPACGSADLRALGQGTERLEAALQRHFPAYPVARVDRDSTRRRGAMQALLEEIAGGHARILVGTQMLAKGHHFPEVTLVGVLDADAGLFSTDFRAGERMAQLIIQVAGRAGRAERPGEVLLQTRHPEHPLLQRLIRDGYPGFVEVALAERRAAGLPPYASLALLRAEATGSLEPALEFLQRVAAAARAVAVPGAEALGPVSAPMERRAGRYRAQLLLQSRRRSRLQALLGALLPQIEGLPSARRVRWSLDVDPLEMF